MKLRTILLSGVLLLALNVGSASAASLTVYFNAHVRLVNDPSGVLAGQVTAGQVATGQYTYDTAVPDQNGDPMYGSYPQGSWQASTQVSVGSVVFETNPASQNWYYDISVHPSDWPGSYWSHFILNSMGNKPLAGGAVVDSIRIAFFDHSGYTPSSEYLPTAAPDLSRYSEKAIEINGRDGGNGYSVVLDIDSVSTINPDSGLLALPATGSFVQGQRFDAALLLPPAAVVGNVHATVDGAPVPLSYPGNCNIGPPNSQGRVAILCPDAAWQLHGGLNHVLWRVELTDGTLLEKSVDWELIQ